MKKSKAGLKQNYQSKIPMYLIEVHPDNSATCFLQIQDGTESWVSSSLEKAIQSMIANAYTLNHIRLNREMINIMHSKKQEEAPCEFSQKDRELLHDIKTGRKVVLLFDDFRLSANLLPSEVEMIFKIREGKRRVQVIEE